MNEQNVMKRASAEEIRDLLVSELATILHLEKANISTSRTFDQYGLDSMDAVVVVGLVEERLGVELEPELLLRNRSIDEVVNALKELGIV